jgi:CHAT domain-containing protein
MTRVIVLSLLIALSCWPAAGGAQTTTDTNSTARALVNEMMQVQESDQKDWLQKNQARITREVAELAENLGDQALRELRTGQAQALYSIAELAYNKIDDRAKYTASSLKYYEIEFQRAKVPEEYLKIRLYAVAYKTKAEVAKAFDVAFGFAVLAADCAYYSGLPDEIKSTDGPWVSVVLADLISAFEAAPKSKDRVTLERLVSLTAITTKLATDILFKNQDEVTLLLTKLGPKVDAVVPANFTYQRLDKSKTIPTASSLSRLRYYSGNPATANARLAAAIEQVRKGENPDLYLSLTLQRYEGERNNNGTPDLLHQLRRDARSVAQEIRRNYRSRSGRVWNAYQLDLTYGDMLTDEFAAEGSETSQVLFADVEALKARTLLDYLVVPRTELASAEDLSRSAILEKEILGFAFESQKEDIRDELNLVSQLSWVFDDKDRNNALMELEQLHEKRKKGFADVANVAALEEIQKALEPNEAIIEYANPYGSHPPLAAKIGILLITKTRFIRVYIDIDKGKELPKPLGFTGRLFVDGKAPVDTSSLGEVIFALRNRIKIKDETSARKLLVNLYDLLIQPLVERGFVPERYSRLIVIPSGMLNVVPFAALMDKSYVPLIQKTAVSVVPSASVWQILQERGGEVSQWVAFANPKPLPSGLPPLEQSAKEVKDIADILKSLRCTTKVAEQATKGRFLANAPGNGLLHISTHGDFPDTNAIDNHSLLLAAADGDGALRAKDVRNLNLSSTRLTVLGVCNGGLYRMGPSDEPYGLVPAFLIAGVQNVLATLWPLDDQFGRRFTVEFYKHLLDKGPAEAYRQACLRFFKEDEFIRNWAGFVMVGPGRPFSSKAVK